MAVRRLDLESNPPPVLDLAPPPPSRYGHPVAAFGVVLALIAALGLPVAMSSSESPNQLATSFRSLPVSAIPALDRVSPLPKEDRPRSDGVVAGVVYVSCTHLWVAQPDGSHERMLLELPGISSPAFAPNGRTIAFVRAGAEGDEMWMTSADGTSVRPVGTLTYNGHGIDAHATGLAWSPDGDSIAFALDDGVHDRWTGGSVIWKWSLSTGEFHKIGVGFPTPVWTERRLGYPALDEEGAPDFIAGRWQRWAEEPKSATTSILGADWAPTNWFHTYHRGAVMLRETEAGDLRLVVKSLWKRHAKWVFDAPPGHDFVDVGQPAFARDASRVFVELIDDDGERDLGILDVYSGDWQLRDYAWEPTTSPVPATTGPLTRAKAETIFETMLSGLGRRTSMTLLGISPGESPLPAGTRVQFTYEDPIRSHGAWKADATLLDWHAKEWRYMTAVVSLRLHDGRVAGDISDVSEWSFIRTLDDAFAYADTVLGEAVPRPTLPDELDLDARNPVGAWTWSGRTAVDVRFTSPNTTRRAVGNGLAFSTIQYGDDISLSMGCGGVNDPEPIDIGGPPAMYDHLAPTRAIVWPATPKDTTDGNFGISGDLSRETITSIARSMVAP